MSRFSLLALVSLIALMGSVAITPTAEAVPSCVNAGNVTGLGSVGCDLGSLNFSDFVVSPVGVAANIFLGGLSAVVANNVNLTFQVSHDPSPASLADILFSYTVKTLSGRPELGGVDLYNAGKNVTIRETVCGTEFLNGVCTTGSLADYVVTGGSIGNATFTPLASTIYVRKDIQLLQNAFISEFTNSHDEPPTEAPEPATLLLLGSSLTALGVAARRRTAKPAAA
jgi:PEP-CTERM motif-containing protein